ncbi:MAG: lytic murein transglycosylase [Thermodesulfobacteriota bacterium]
MIFVLFILFTTVAYGQDSNEIPSFYQMLIYRLSQEGFDFGFLSQLFIDPRAVLNPSLMTLSLVSRETTELYIPFLTPESILLAKTFLRENLKILKEMEKRFNVDKEVVVAILLVESRFGENIGKYRVIPTLASIALMDSSENLLKNYEILWEDNPEISFEWLENRGRRRAHWAYNELKYFLKIIRHEEIDPLEVYGSKAGAMGMAQFIPSSYLVYALNEKGLEKWLLNKEEAIFSIGNYLKSHGWKKNLSIEKKKRILWYYNYSEPYIETVFRVAQKIKH